MARAAGTVAYRDLVASVADLAGVTKRDARAVLNALAERIRGAVVDGAVVGIPGLGRFEVVRTKERVGRNPRTGEVVRVPAGRKLRFRPAAQVKRELAS